MERLGCVPLLAHPQTLGLTLCLQPVALNVSSAHLTVSALVFLNITLLAPPAIQILSVSAFISQQFQLSCMASSLQATPFLSSFASSQTWNRSPA